MADRICNAKPRPIELPPDRDKSFEAAKSIVWQIDDWILGPDFSFPTSPASDKSQKPYAN